jgi:methyl-accepting chemotaxis protein
MKSITKHVERSSQEQARGSKQITHSIENINEIGHPPQQRPEGAQTKAASR